MIKKINIFKSSSISYFMLFGVLHFCICTTFFFIFFLDPLNIYSWGRDIKISKEPYNDFGNQNLLSAIVKSNFDGLIIGGSTSRGLEASLASSIFSDTKRFFTFTYGGPRPADQRVVFNKVRTMTNLKRIVVALDWYYMLPQEVKNSGFPFYLYNEKLSDDYGLIRYNNILAAFQSLMRKELKVSDWMDDDASDRKHKKYAAWQKPKKVSEVKRIIQAGSGIVLEPSAQNCSDLSAISDFTEFANGMAERGIKVDVLISPLSLFAYYEWNIQGKSQKNGQAFFERQILLRKCIASRLRSEKNVTLHAFDNVEWITGDLGNYYDPYHIYLESVYRYILESIRDKKHVLTFENFDDYAFKLRSRVSTYSYYNSKVVTRND